MDAGSGGTSWQDLFQALIKAKTKNLLEEIKLRRELDMLEVERLHFDKLHFNNIFEQKKVVYRMRLETLLMRLRAQDRECEDAEQSAPCISGGAAADGHDQEEAWDGLLNTEPRYQTTPLTGYLLPGHHSRANTRYRCTSRPQVPKEFYNPGHQTKSRSHHQGTYAASAMKPSDCIKKDFTEAIESILNRGFEQRLQPTGRHYQDKRQPSKYQDPSRPTVLRSKTFPELRSEPSKVDPRKVGLDHCRNKGVYVSGHWVGDPKAISSVRRARKPPEELVARHRHKAVGDIRRLLNQMTGFGDCSRNCQRQARVDRVQDSLPSVILDSTQLNALKQKAAMLDTDVKPSLPMPHHQPKEAEVAESAKGSQKRQEIRERIRQLEEATKDISNQDIIEMFGKHPRKSLLRVSRDDDITKSIK